MTIQKRKSKIAVGLISRIFKHTYARCVGKAALIVQVYITIESGL